MSHGDKAKIVSRGAEVSTMHHQGHPVSHPSNHQYGESSGKVSSRRVESAKPSSKKAQPKTTSSPLVGTTLTEVVTHSAPQEVTEVVTHITTPRVVSSVQHVSADEPAHGVMHSPTIIYTSAAKRRSSSSRSSKATGRLVTNRTYYDDRVIVIPKKETVRERSVKSMPVKKRVIEVEKVYEVEEIVEIPEIEIIEEVEEVVVKKIVNRTIEKPVEEVIDVIKEVPIEQIEEVIVEVPEVRYNDIVTEKVVEVPTTREVVKTIEKPVRIYRDVITTVEKDVHQSRNVTRKIPVPVEARIAQHFTVPNLKKKYKTHKYEAILPEFQEYAVHRSAVTNKGLTLLNEIHDTLNQPSVGLCHLETLYSDVKTSDFLEEPTFVPKHRIFQDIVNKVPHLANVHNIHYREVALEDLSCSVRSKGTTRTPLPSKGKAAGKKGACC